MKITDEAKQILENFLIEFINNHHGINQRIEIEKIRPCCKVM